MELDISTGYYVSSSLPVSAQECTNWYVNVPQAPALSRAQLFGTPGVAQVATTGTVKQRNRGAWVKDKIPYFVNGGALYRLDFTAEPEAWAAVNLGAIEGEGRVSLASNPTQLMILVPGGKGYIYNENAVPALQEITDPDFTANGNPQHVVFIDGYFAVTTDEKKWIISGLNDGLSWNALDFASAETDPDEIVAPVKVRNQIFITGSATTEGFQNIGGAGFPFQRNYVSLDKGCSAPFSLVSAYSSFFMVGAGENESPAIWQFSGNNYEKISTTAIDSMLQAYSQDDISQAFGWSHAQKGAYFIGFTFPDRTFCYDMITRLWHERASDIGGARGRWRINSIVTAYGRVLVGDSVDGRIGVLSPDTYTEYASNIIRVFATRPFADGGADIYPDKIELTVESGVGDADTPDPKVSMAMSRDGKTFDYERVRGMGPIGEYGRRVIWRKNGRFPRLAVLRFRLSDPVKPVIIKLEAE